MDATYWSMDECRWVSWSPGDPAGESGLDATAAIPPQAEVAPQPSFST